MCPDTMEGDIEARSSAAIKIIAVPYVPPGAVVLAVVRFIFFSFFCCCAAFFCLVNVLIPSKPGAWAHAPRCKSGRAPKALAVLSFLTWLASRPFFFSHHHSQRCPCSFLSTTVFASSF
eukprot:1190062-Rhodomonas_salina.1